MFCREVKEHEKNRWDEFVANQESGGFTQSWEWSEFLISLNKKVWRIAVVDADIWVATALLTKSEMKLGQAVLACPRGPVISSDCNFELVAELILREIDKIAAKENCLSSLVDPASNDSRWCQVYNSLEYVKSPTDTQPRHTLILDIRQGAEEILSKMHQKTRYNLRLAEKKGVTVAIENNAIKDFANLMALTESRQNIAMQSTSYFKKLLAMPFAELLIARYEGKPVAGNIVIYWNHQATYLFGASDHALRQIMAPYLLQWFAIKEAQARGMWFYDFWGAAPENASGRETAWSGFTKFKRGFSPDLELTEYLGNYEKVYQPVKLGLYRFLRQIYRGR